MIFTPGYNSRYCRGWKKPFSLSVTTARSLSHRARGEAGKNLVELPHIVEWQVDKPESPLLRQWSFDILHGQWTTPYPHSHYSAVTVIDKSVQRAQMGVCPGLYLNRDNGSAFLPNKVHLCSCSLLVPNPEVLLFPVIPVKNNSQFLCHDMFSSPTAPSIKQLLVQKILCLDARQLLNCPIKSLANITFSLVYSNAKVRFLSNT